jgi:predicted ABC-type ATPase
MTSPTLYIVAGPNGIGKTTSFFDVIPRNIPVINSDEIASEIRRKGNAPANTQELANAEAIRMMDIFLRERTSFGMETNLADVETWKAFLQIQESGYQLYVLYLSTNDLDLLNTRIQARHQQGGHFVRPDIVEERYLSGLKLLNHYLTRPDKVLLYDNSIIPRLIAEIEKGKIIKIEPQLPDWVSKHVLLDSNQSMSQEIRPRDLDSIEEVRKRYLENKKADKGITGKADKPIGKSLGRGRSR